jgi:DNA replication protein DnaC
MEWAKWFRFEMVGTVEELLALQWMVSNCALFIKAMKTGQPPFWLSILGSSGAGKTHLAKRIYNWHQACGRFETQVKPSESGMPEIIYPREWCNWTKLASRLKGNDGYERLKELEDASFVVIDEIGATRDVSGHVTDCLANLLSARVGKWTIITSNLTLGDVQRSVDTRVASRMLRGGSLVVDVNVRDYNLRK